MYKWGVCILLFFSAASAQLEPEAQQLWDTFIAQVERAAEEASADASTEDISSFQTTWTTRIVIETEPYTMRTVTLVDIAGRRMVTTTESEVGGEMMLDSWMLYDDGDIVMYSMFEGDIDVIEFSEAEAEEMAAQFEAVFDLSDPSTDPGTMADMTDAAFEPESYDGFKRYGEVLAGEQFTLGDLTQDIEGTPMATLFSAGLPEAFSLILTEEGLVAGQRLVIEGEDRLIVFSRPTVYIDVPAHQTVYRLEGEMPVWESDVQMQVEMNTPLDERLFAPPEGAN